MSRFLSKRLSSLKEYVPGEQPKDKSYVKLNTNESPFPPAKGVIDCISSGVLSDLKLYCDPVCSKLTEAVCGIYGVGPENVIFGNGSDEILSFAFTAFCDKQTPAIFPDITYGFYKVFADLNCIDCKEVPLCDDFTVRTEDYMRAGGTIFIANPNAPTGIMLAVSDIEKILDANKDTVVVIDEAYVDFGGESCIGLTEKYDNLIVVRTFSKSRSLAGARLGYAFGSPELIRDLQTVRNSNNPYNVNTLTQLMGAASVTDTEYFRKCTEAIMENREYLTKKLTKRNFDVLPSKANFIFARSASISGAKLYEELKSRGVLVRHFSKDRIKDYVRITIGSREELDKLVMAIDDII